jgi:hypothetical protein
MLSAATSTASCPVWPSTAPAQAGLPQLALTYYRENPAGCVGSTCQIKVRFVSSLNNGSTWSAQQTLSDPMQLGLLAPTNQGVMVGDYISTSFLAGQQRAIGAFAVGSPPPSAGMFDEAMFAGLEKVRTGTTAMTRDPVQSTSVARDLTATHRHCRDPASCSADGITQTVRATRAMTVPQAVRQTKPRMCRRLPRNGQRTPVMRPRAP